MMVWQLLQVGFMTERPVVLVGEMWRRPARLDAAGDGVLASSSTAEDLDLVHLSMTIDDAIAMIDRHKQKFDAAREMLILERRRAARAEQDPPPATSSPPSQLFPDDLPVVEGEAAARDLARREPPRLRRVVAALRPPRTRSAA